MLFNATDGRFWGTPSNGQSVCAYDGNTGAVAASIGLPGTGGGSWGTALDEARQIVYATAFQTCCISRLHRINVATLTPIDYIDAGIELQGIGVDAGACATAVFVAASQDAEVWIAKDDDACSPDTDGDGVPDSTDNCPTAPNGPAQAGIPGVGNQTNTDAANATPPNNRAGTDALGDACDDDDDGDGYTETQEAAVVPAKSDLLYCEIMRADVQPVPNGDGSVTILDLSLVASKYGQTVPPAPARYNQDGDNVITILDLSRMATRYLQNVSACP